MNHEATRIFRTRCLCWFNGDAFHGIGIVMLLACTIAATIAGYSFVSGNIMAAMGLSVIGCSISLLSILAFIVSSFPAARSWNRRSACAVVVFLLPFTVGVVGIAFENGRQKRWTERTRNAMMDLVAEIEAIRVQTGKVPPDETQLANRLGKTMPAIDRQSRLQHERDRFDPRHYRIWCVGYGFGSDILEYDSRNALRRIVHRSP